MVRKLLLVMTVLAILMPLLGAHAKTIDMDNLEDELLQLTKEELVLLFTWVSEVMQTKEMDKANLYYPGYYTVGEDIEPGQYLVTNMNDSRVYYDIYDDETARKEDEPTMALTGDAHSTVFINLKEGTILYIYYITKSVPVIIVPR